jgi:hypothetical protein
MPAKRPQDAAQLQQFQQAQGQLSNALSRLMMVTENYPQLRATEAFQNLQVQLEGTENRISGGAKQLQRCRPGVQHRDGHLPNQHAEQDVRLPAATILHRASWERASSGSELPELWLEPCRSATGTCCDGSSGNARARGNAVVGANLRSCR